MKKAYYFETFCGKDYFRDAFGNVYTVCDGQPAFCSNLKQGQLTEDKAEPSYPVSDVVLLYKDRTERSRAESPPAPLPLNRNRKNA